MGLLQLPQLSLNWPVRTWEGEVFAQPRRFEIAAERFPPRQALLDIGLQPARRYTGTSAEPALLAMFEANVAAGDEYVYRRRQLTASVWGDDDSCFWETGSRFLLPQRFYGLFEFCEYDLAQQCRIALNMRKGLNLLGLNVAASRGAAFIESVPYALQAILENHGVDILELGPHYWAFIYVSTLAGVTRKSETFQPVGEPLFQEPEHIMRMSGLEIYYGDSQRYPRQLDTFSQLVRSFTPLELETVLGMYTQWSWDNLVQLAEVHTRFDSMSLAQQAELAKAPRPFYVAMVQGLG